MVSDLRKPPTLAAEGAGVMANQMLMVALAWLRLFPALARRDRMQ